MRWGHNIRRTRTYLAVALALGMALATVTGTDTATVEAPPTRAWAAGEASQLASVDRDGDEDEVMAIDEADVLPDRVHIERAD